MAQVQTRTNIAPTVALAFLTLAAVLVLGAMFANLVGQMGLASALLIAGGVVVVITFLTAMFFILRDIFTS